MPLILCPKTNAPRVRGVVRLPKRGRAGRSADQAGWGTAAPPERFQRFIKPRYHSWKCFMPSSMGDW